MKKKPQKNKTKAEEDKSKENDKERVNTILYQAKHLHKFNSQSWYSLRKPSGYDC